MTTEPINTLVFRGQAGEYYVLPQAVLEQGRVPAEHTAEIERLIAEHQDVQGHSVAHAVATPVAVMTVGAYLIWSELYNKPLGGLLAQYAEEYERRTR